MTSRLAVLLLLVAAFILIMRENLTQRPKRLYQTTTGQVEMCLSCHKTEKLDTAHDTRVLGCSTCHLGAPRAIDKKAAHKGLVINPGDLRVVEKTCGIDGCHAPDVKRVKNSLMATNRGILATLLYYWGEAPDQRGDFSVEKLLAGGTDSLAIDYYRKLCGTCHLWKQRRDFPGFFGEKGGGCTACHYVPPPAGDPPAGKGLSWLRVLLGRQPSKQPHPLITKKVPMDNCLRCHNRSGRIGVSYTGVYEAEGYGTPYENGGLSSKKLPGSRFYQELPDDVHHKEGMTCIDCHTRNEIMGDGNNFAHYEEQLEISCITCHTAGTPGTTRKNNTLPNLKAVGDNYFLFDKLTGQPHPLLPPKAGTCDYPGHKRLLCESCHSTWVPQCYGCHVKRDMNETHLDKLTMKETPGWWEEGLSYIRYEQPTLAVWADKVVVVTPGCQDIVTLLDKKSKITGGFNHLTMAAISPHTTQSAGRSCVDCHTSPKTVGLGEGTLQRVAGQYKFTPLGQGVETVAGRTAPLDAYVSIDGRPLQNSSRADLRPFNKEELARILRVGRCLPCHRDYNDPVFVDYDRNKQCSVFEE